MALTPADLDRYCVRIGFEGQLRADLATLRRLHHLHPLAIPFENLDAWLGTAPSLSSADVFEKLVLRGRGGYCFEHNLLFREVLETLGFPVRGLAARVTWQLPDQFLLPRTHMLLLVTNADVRFVADVGFGGLTLTAPLHLDSTAEQQTPHESCRLVPEPEHYVLQANVAGQWQALYRFSLEEQRPADYAMANWYVGTHPRSRFVQQLIAGRAAHGMRHALLDTRYTRHQLDGASESRQLPSPDELRRVLQQDLHIDVAGLPQLDARLQQLCTSSSPPGSLT